MATETTVEEGCRKIADRQRQRAEHFASAAERYAKLEKEARSELNKAAYASSAKTYADLHKDTLSLADGWMQTAARAKGLEARVRELEHSLSTDQRLGGIRRGIEERERGAAAASQGPFRWISKEGDWRRWYPLSSKGEYPMSSTNFDPRTVQHVPLANNSYTPRNPSSGAAV